MTAPAATRRPGLLDQVHYVTRGLPTEEYPSLCRGGLVAGVPVGELSTARGQHAETWGPDSVVVDLLVLNVNGSAPVRCPYGPATMGGTWHWPDDCGTP